MQCTPQTAHRNVGEPPHLACRFEGQERESLRMAWLPEGLLLPGDRGRDNTTSGFRTSRVAGLSREQQLASEGGAPGPISRGDVQSGPSGWWAGCWDMEPIEPTCYLLPPCYLGARCYEGVYKLPRKSSMCLHKEGCDVIWGGVFGSC